MGQHHYHFVNQKTPSLNPVNDLLFYLLSTKQRNFCHKLWRAPTRRPLLGHLDSGFLDKKIV